MLKKLLTISGIFIASLSCAHAASLYIAPALAYENIYINKNGYQALLPILSLGYGGMIPETFFYIAGEVFGSPKSIDLNNKPKHGYSLKTQYNYGASIIPGYVFDTVFMGYLRLGGIVTRFSEMGVEKSGGEAGVGFEACVTPNWSARAEYDFIKYRKISGVGQPRTGQYSVGAVFRFG